MSATLASPDHDILALATACLSAAPDLTEAERTSRSQAVIGGTMAFQPADPSQTVLASLILGHHLTIMDGFRDIACLALTPAEAARARMVTVAQTRIVLQLARELRTARAAAPTHAPARQPAAEPAPARTGDAQPEALPANFLTTYDETLATLESPGPLTPAAATRALEALAQAMPTACGGLPVQETAVAVPVGASRAQRRALMKRRGAFKRTA